MLEGPRCEEDFVAPLTAVASVHDNKVVIDCKTLETNLRRGRSRSRRRKARDFDARYPVPESASLYSCAVTDRSFHFSQVAIRFAYSALIMASIPAPKKTRRGGSTASTISRIAGPVARGFP